jgi:hypothetical protein
MTRGFGRFLRHNTIALLALFVALGGTSFAAATLLNGSQIKPHTIAKNRLTNKAIKQLKGNRGPRGAQGAQGAPGTQGPKGTTGAQGPAGTARAYAFVNADDVTPTFDPARTFNFTAVRRAPSTVAGVYCLTPAASTGITAANAAPVTNPVYTGGQGFTEAHVEFRKESTECTPAELEFVARANNANSSALPFTVIVP